MKIRLIASLVVLIVGITSVAYADLNSFLASVNVEARTDMKNFSVKLSTQFGVPLPQVDVIVRSVAAPADAFMVLQLGHMSHQQPQAVLQTYQRKKGKGWGELAKELGIKPGSREFHALKRGDLSFTGKPGDGYDDGGHGKGKGMGKGKGHNK